MPIDRDSTGSVMQKDVASYVGAGGGGNIGSDNLWAAKGDLIVGVGSHSAQILPRGTNTQVLTVDTTTTTGLKWAASAGGGGNVATDTIWDAKGDLAVGTGADTAQKLIVGTNGRTLFTDSTQTTGLKWAVPYAINLVTDYGVSTGASAASNATAIMLAMADVTTGGNANIGRPLYLPGAPIPYPCNTITIPSEPFMWFGDGSSQSVLGTTGNGPMLTYVNTVAGLNGAGDPWSVGNVSYGQHFKTKQWTICRLGFTGGNNFTGWDFPQWSGTSHDDQLTMWAEDIIVSNCGNGGGAGQSGINYLINGCWNDSVFIRVVSFGNARRGFTCGSDSRWISCLSMNNGEEGFYIDGKNSQLVGCKSYGNGQLNRTGSLTSGFYVRGTGVGPILTGCEGQDNNGPGLWIDQATRVIVQGFVTDRNCWNGNTFDATNNAGVRVSDSNNIQIDGIIASDSQSGRTNQQNYALRVNNTSGTTNYSNRITLVQSSFGGGAPVLVNAVDPSSDLNGTDVKAGASGGGIYTLAFNATVTPDPYLAQTNYMVLTGNVTSVAAPANKHHGQVLNLLFLASGGTRTIPANASWNAIYKLNGTVATSGTTGQRTTFEFTYDAANSLWIQTSPLVPTAVGGTNAANNWF